MSKAQKREAPKKRKFDAGIFLVSLLCMAPIAATIVWTFLPAIKSGLAVMKLSTETLQISETSSEEELLTLKRQIQRQFLDYSVYIPTEDIVVFQNGDSRKSSLSSLMTAACGKSDMYVWVPFKIALPFYGEKVIEWCWKPKLQILK